MSLSGISSSSYYTSFLPAPPPPFSTSTGNAAALGDTQSASQGGPQQAVQPSDQSQQGQNQPAGPNASGLGQIVNISA